MERELAEALAPVLRDLADSDSVIPEVRDDQWSTFEGQATAMLFSPSGCGQGVSATADEPLVQRIAWAADQVQEWAVEELCSIGRPTNWPQCPQHPDSHPLSAVVREDRAVWCCPKTGYLATEVGELGRPG